MGQPDSWGSLGAQIQGGPYSGGHSHSLALSIKPPLGAERKTEQSTHYGLWDNIRYKILMSSIGLVSSIYEEILQLNYKKANNSILKNRERTYFPKNIREWIICIWKVNIMSHQGNIKQNHMTSHYTTRMAKIKVDVTECWWGSEMQKCSHLEDGLAISYKVKCTLSTPSSNSTPNYP